MRALAAWLETAGITKGPVFRRLWLPRKTQPDESPPPPRMGSQAITPWAVAAIVKAAPQRRALGRGTLAATASSEAR